METIGQLRNLFRFNDWANRVIVRSIRQTSCDEALRHLCHVLITEREYFERLYGKDSTGFDFWTALSIDDCSKLAQANNEAFEKLLRHFDDEGLGQKVRYRTSEGERVSNTFREILTHVILHSMNHRGQILTILRQNGFEPPVIDYIIYERNR